MNAVVEVAMPPKITIWPMWVKICERLGIPVAVLAVVLWGGWVILGKASEKAEKYLGPAIEAHIKNVNSQTETNAKIAKSMENQEVVIKAIRDSQETMVEILKEQKAAH